LPRHTKDAEPDVPLYTKRVYQQAVPEDGYRVLVDRLWPRGVRKDRLRLDEWNKSLAPSSDLRRSFGHDPERWEAFKTAYFAELDRHPAATGALAERARNGSVTLLFAARDEVHNNAVALKEYLEGPTAPPANSNRP